MFNNGGNSVRNKGGGEERNRGTERKGIKREREEGGRK